MSVFFSIIIPTYNRANDLKRCLESLLSQTYQNFEVLVCDDGSTDNTKDIVNEFTNQLNIHYIWEENWGGPARPRNNGIRAAKGDWICFLDSDDYWYPSKLESCLPYLKDNDLVYHHFDVVGENIPSFRNKLLCREIDRNNAFLDLLLNWNGLATSGVAVKKSIIVDSIFFDENRNLIGVEDCDLWLQIAQKTNRFFLVPKVLGAYYLSEVSLTKNVINSIEKERNLLNKYKSFITEEQIKNLQIKIIFSGGIKFLINRDRVNANKYFFNVLLSKTNLKIKIKAFLYITFGNYIFILSKLLFDFKNKKAANI